MKKFLLFISCLLAFGATSAQATGTWEKLTKNDVLSNGDIVTLVSLPTTVNNVGDIPSLVSVSCENDIIKLNEYALTDGVFSVEPLKIILEENGTNWNLKVGESYIIAKSGKNNAFLDSTAQPATISIDENGLATIAVSVSKENRVLQFNHNTDKNNKDYVSRARIAFYKSTQKNCYLYRFTPAGEENPDPVDPVEPSNLTIKYGDISVAENDEVSVTEGTEFNISAKDATSITITDIDDNILANFDSSSCKWTPEVMEENIITVTASNEVGEIATMFSLTVAEKPFTPTDVTDVLTVTTFGISGTTYSEYTGTVGNAEYKAYANSNNKNTPSGAAANQVIGLRIKTDKGYGGIVTTVSPGYAVKVIATQWKQQAATGRSLTIYGQNTPYTTGKDTPEGRNWGEKLGEIAIESGVAKELILSGGYKYIAIMPNGGACQLSEIKIEWASEKPSLPEGGLDFTTVDVEDAFTISKDAESAEITISGVHAESHLYHKFTPAATETPEAAPRKLVDHTGYTKVERNDDNTHTVTVSEPGTLELYAYHPATDSKSEIKTITVTKASGTTAIDEIGADVVEGEAEYFNLQGVKINPENATPGLYIRRQGGKVAKVVVK
ncbi:MAG: hypothetical protein K2L30_02765 [Duncaniella sp.]|nr:hypothetical protein [Duncaniella sp.]